jgi:hypothetical protein
MIHLDEEKNELPKCIMAMCVGSSLLTRVSRYCVKQAPNAVPCFVFQSVSPFELRPLMTPDAADGDLNA